MGLWADTSSGGTSSVRPPSGGRSGQTPDIAGGRLILMIAFWAWGAIGLLIVLLDFGSLPSDVGVGTSAYMIVVEMIWIGGMLLFGVGALFLPPRSLPMPISEKAPLEATKTCPQCAETVKAAAKICRFCRYEFPPEPPPETAACS
jgi:hypothetical protein